MAQMSQYCKAYTVNRFRAFPSWHENSANARKRPNPSDGDGAAERTSLADDDIIYLHDNYVVADGIFRDENVIFDAVTDSWKQFCHETLQFKIPEYQTQAKA